MRNVARKIPAEPGERSPEKHVADDNAQRAPMTEWQRRIIAERLAEYHAGTAGPGRTWEEVRQALRMKLDALRR